MKNFLKKGIAVILFAGLSICLFGQSTVSGTVKDNDGNPVLGASVLVSGTTIGAATDLNGNFTIKDVPQGAQKITAQAIGYSSSTQEVNVSRDMTLAFVLNEDALGLDELVVTATATFRSQKESPLSITSIRSSKLTKLNANSQADILRNVPGITAEGGGGEGAVNIFVRGFPSGGQNDFTPIQFDGFTLAGYGLSSTAGDVYARVDQGLKGVEFVRGGAAILFGAGSTAGIINYTSKTGDTHEENIVNMEFGTVGRVKTDFYSGGKLGDDNSNTYYAFSGWIRRDDGPLDFGLPSEGFQLRGNLKKKFNNGSFTVYTQLINDRQQFIMPLPLSGGSRERLNGNDGETVYQLNSSHLRNTSFLTPSGEYRSPIEDGIHTKGYYVMGEFLYDLANDWKVKFKAKYSDYISDFALYIGGNGAQPWPTTLSNYVSNLSSATTNYSANIVGGGNLSGSDRVIDNLHIDRHRPVSDLVGEFNILKIINKENATHNVNFGLYLASSRGEDINYQFRTLSTFNNEPKLINLSYTDTDGNNVIYSSGGLTNRIGKTSNKYLAHNRTAIYLTDEIELEKWRIDVGFRLERQEGVREDGALADRQVYSDAGLTSNLQNVRAATGAFTRAEFGATDWAGSLAALYRLNSEINLYANLARGYFFPLVRNVSIANNNEIGSYDTEKVIQGELGLKYGGEKLSGTFAAYYSKLKDRTSVRRADVIGIGLVEARETVQNTRTLGVEATFNWELADNLSFGGTLTLQNHKLVKNTQTDLVSGTTTGSNPVILVKGQSISTNEGNELVRQPNFITNLSFDYDDDAFDGFISMFMRDATFGNPQNTVTLDGYALLRAGAGYTFTLDESKKFRLGFSVFNLTNKQGITEGNPRDLNQQNDSDFFFGRPELPRRFFFNATLTF